MSVYQCGKSSQRSEMLADKRQPAFAMPFNNRVIVQLSQTIGIDDSEAIQRILSPVRECGICAFHDQQIFVMERIREGFSVSNST